MRGLVLSALLTLVTLSCSAGDNGWKCEWFGIGCPDGELNQVLMDLGRESTNTGFLFFEGDTAVIERTLELTFSKRSIAKQDKLYIQVSSEGLPEGATVTLDGTSCHEPDDVAFMARTQKEKVVLRWVIPPSGEDVDLSGTVQIRPYGFDRAGSMAIRGKEGRAIEMLRIQGEVDHDWHWAKRLLFWFVVLTLTIYVLWKFVVARGVHHRFDRLSVRFEVGVERRGTRTPFTEETLWLEGVREVMVGSQPKRPSGFNRHMNGRVTAVDIPSMPDGLIFSFFPGGFIEPFGSPRPEGGHVVRVCIGDADVLHAQQFHPHGDRIYLHYGENENVYIHIKDIDHA